MPARTRRQQKYLYWKFGKEWVKRHHFDRLAKGRSKKRRTERRRKTSRKHSALKRIRKRQAKRGR